MAQKSLKILLSFAVVAAVIVTTQCGEKGFNLSPFAGGSGRYRDPYRIKTVKHLNHMRDYKNSYFELVNDLDFNGTAFSANCQTNRQGWEPIDSFSGVFYGHGHKIKNLYINRPEVDYVGLFSIIDSCAIIESLLVVDANVAGKGSVGILAGANRGKIRFCRVAGDITGKNACGAFVGFNQHRAEIQQCFGENGVVKVDKTSSGEDGAGGGVGGFVGVNYGIINGSSVQNMTVEGTASVGGFAGGCYAYSKIGGCSVENGKVSGRTMVGGFIGDNDHTTIYGCFAIVSVEGSGSTGGFAGKTDGTISRSFSEGKVASSGNEMTGGFAGYNQGKIFGCYSNCTTQSKLDRTGGFAGYSDGSIEQCYVTGDVTAKSIAGGFVGECGGFIGDCLAIGDVAAHGDQIGGFVGKLNSSGTIWKVYSLGKVSGMGEKTGGLIGNKEICDSVTNCFWDASSSRQKYSDGGMMESSEAMKSILTYKNSGWNFDTVWYMHELVNQGYPFLQIMDIVPLSYSKKGEPVVSKINNNDIQLIHTSSILSQGKCSYVPENMFDGNLTTAWAEGDSGNGEWEWFEVMFKKRKNIKGVVIVNGYVRTKETYLTNNRIKSICVSNIGKSVTLGSGAILHDLSYVKYNNVVGEKANIVYVADKLRFDIGSIYKGTKYNDACISEIIFIEGQ